jgi:hypothetical protein
MVTETSDGLRGIVPFFKSSFTLMIRRRPELDNTKYQTKIINIL